MNITIIGRKCTPRNSFKERAEQKLLKVEKFFGNDANAKVTATVEKNIKIVEITLTRGGLIFRAQERSQDLEDALDACVDSLIRQIRKNKTKLEKKLHEASFDDILTSAEDEETNFEIIRIKSIFLRPQSIDEAVLQMNMLGHQFYMFRNAATDLVSVVYKRADGGYGVIEPND
ncbi:MAG: ribosome-associated translation inhibitor RaiA [Oscillospiraceae bacterium]